MQPTGQKDLSQEQLDQIELFLSAYNSIDHYLRKFINKGKETSFTHLVKSYADRYPRWGDQEQLIILGDLRNYLVHDREGMYQYLSIPTPAVVESIQRIQESFLAPELVIPRFQAQVRIIHTDDRLSGVLKIINKESFSQFPVYKGDTYIGLLTENGITRWLAAHVHEVLTLVEFDEINVEEVMKQEEDRPNHDFITRSTTILEGESKFSTNPSLEALFITHNGKKEEKLMGIMTRWDLLTL